MAKIGKTTTSFKIYEVPEDPHENVRKITGKYEIRGTSLERSFSDLGTEKRSSRTARYPRRSKPEDSLEPTTSTTTPETLKVSPVVPNAPMKPPRTSKKVDMTRKRLQFMEEAETQSVDSGVDLNLPKHRYPTRACKNNISENVRPQTSKGKQLRPTRPNSRINWSDVDKENDGNLANSRQIEPKNRSSSQKAHKNSTKSLASQNQFKPEGDFAHFRI